MHHTRKQGEIKARIDDRQVIGIAGEKMNRRIVLRSERYVIDVVIQGDDAIARGRKQGGRAEAGARADIQDVDAVAGVERVNRSHCIFHAAKTQAQDFLLPIKKPGVFEYVSEILVQEWFAG